MHKDINVIVTEGHDLVRRYLKRVIERRKHFHVVAEAANEKETLIVIKHFPADLIVLGLSLSQWSGLQIIKESKIVNPAKILALTNHMDSDDVQQILDAGADGICRKDADAKILEQAILETLDAKRPIYPENKLASRSGLHLQK